MCLDGVVGGGGRVAGDVEDYRRKKKDKVSVQMVYNKTLHHRFI